ncbi:hypothetical protein GWK47_030790 [Chionoecetes opilio]|uniref:Uncharacterized protein n=1 Tax=Chionoecetes opilio TaxID=41210 RepID=A0A8J4YRI7_CHIOP|nr:hypothetical protein GWK47_030790 [Chionoecetes opilio]
MDAGVDAARWKVLPLATELPYTRIHVPNERSDEVVVEDRIGNENITEENIVFLDVAPDDLEVFHDPSTLPQLPQNTRNTTQASKPSRRVLWTKKTDSSPSSIRVYP